MTGCLNYEVFDERKQIVKTHEIKFKDYGNVTRILYILRSIISSYGLRNKAYSINYSIRMNINGRDWTREAGRIFFDRKKSKTMQYVNDIQIKTSKVWKQNELF